MTQPSHSSNIPDDKEKRLNALLEKDEREDDVFAGIMIVCYILLWIFSVIAPFFLSK